MSRARGIIYSLVMVQILLLPRVSLAAPTPSLVLSQFKVSANDGQFFQIYNSTDAAIDMSTVQLVYYNHYNVASASSSKVISLSGILPARSYYLVNDGPLTLCYRMLILSQSLGFSTTAGHVELQRVTQATIGGPLINTTEDAASWSKTLTSGIPQLPSAPTQFLLRQPVDGNNNPQIASPGAGSWGTVSIDATNPCLYTSTNIVPAPVISTSLLLLSSTPPPVTFLTSVGQSGGPSLPPADIGLLAPVVNELLPNPGVEQTDDDDEFIELYNPNDKPFDLTGFQLEVGLTTRRRYTFPPGTILPPKSFVAYRSEITNLSLSNSGSFASLLDPFGNAISSSAEYSSAKDNQAWALANTAWVWTTKPTPGESNIISAPATKTSTTNSSTKASPASNGSVAGAGTTSQGSDTEEAKVAELHPSALASVAVLAVGYGAYEYKQDIANYLRKRRGNRAARR